MVSKKKALITTLSSVQHSMLKHSFDAYDNETSRVSQLALWIRDEIACVASFSAISVSVKRKMGLARNIYSRRITHRGFDCYGSYERDSTNA